MKKTTAILTLILMLAVTAAGCTAGEAPADKAADMPAIGILQLVQHGALDAAAEGFIAALADNGYVNGETVKIDHQNAQGDTNNLSTISDMFVSNNVDLVLAIATPAVQAMAGKTATIPILGTAVTDYEIAKLVDSNDAPGGNVSGTSDMNPIDDQIALLCELAPGAKTIGLLYTSSEDNSILQAGIAKESIAARGLAAVEVTVNNSNDVQQAVQSIVGQCDAIYIPTDNTFASAMPVVYGVTAESKTPVVCGENNMVMSGGLASLGVDYYKLGYQTGLMAVKILKDGADIAAMPVEFPAELTPSINITVAEEIGVTIPDAYKDFTVELSAAE